MRTHRLRRVAIALAAALQQGSVILGASAPNDASGGGGDEADFPHEHDEEGGL